MKYLSRLLTVLSMLVLFVLMLAPSDTQAAASVAKLKLNSTKVYMASSKTYTLKVTALGADGKEIKAADLKETVKYKTSNKKVATVSAAGKITPKSTGICTITVSAGDVTAKCKVYVLPNVIASSDFVCYGLANNMLLPELYTDNYYRLSAADSPIAWVWYAASQVEYYDCTASEYLMTNRGTYLGQKKSTVERTYGSTGVAASADEKTDGFLHVIGLLAPGLPELSTAVKSVSYPYVYDDTYQIRFYFDKDDKLVLMGYVKGFSNDVYLSIGEAANY